MCIRIDLKYKPKDKDKLPTYGIEDEEAKKKETVSAIHALLNSEGGEVNLVFTGTVKLIDPVLKSIILADAQKSFIRKIEQILVQSAGIGITTYNVNFKRETNNEWVLVEIKSANVLIISNTNLYLPTVEQVTVVNAADPEQRTIHEILNRRSVENGIIPGSHSKQFFLNRSSGLHESKVVEFKFPKAASAKRTKLADRMTGKSNKFSFYVSAFANYQGGHIYYGIADNGIVEGEFISSEEDKYEITKKVEKTFNKMIWPEQIGQPNRGVHWDIFFKPVVDENFKLIPSTFVIVVYIAPCFGGVFAAEPECYEMVKGEVQKMSFATWKRRMLFYSDKIPDTLQRITRIKSHCAMINELLTQCLNKGECIADLAKHFTEVNCPELIEVQLVILSKQVMECYRRLHFVKAQELLEQYDDLMHKVKKGTLSDILDAIRAYLVVALHRARGDGISLRKTLPDALNKAEKIEPCTVTAGIFLLAATVLIFFPSMKKDIVGRDERYSPDVLSNRALEHLQNVQDSPIVRADLEHKVHITLALFYLDYNTSNHVLTKTHLDIVNFEKAKSSVTAVNKSISEGNPINHYREVQFDVVQSIFYYRQSQIQSDEIVSLLQKAFSFSKKAQRVACLYRFDEMHLWASTCIALCTEGLVRTDLKTCPKQKVNH